VSKVGAACQFRGVYAASILFSFTGVVPHVLACAQLFTQLALSTFYETQTKDC
jgi:hypothetical protein